MNIRFIIGFAVGMVIASVSLLFAIALPYIVPGFDPVLSHMAAWTFGAFLVYVVKAAEYLDDSGGTEA